MKPLPDVRPSPIAGRWYSSDPARLSSEVDDFMAAARLPELGGEVVGLVAPHAGYQYSGPVAGYAFRAVQGQAFDLVAIISPMHQPYPQPFLTSDHQAYQTPLGSVEIDRESVMRLDGELEALCGMRLAAVARDEEHALEIELPFLQRALSGPFQLLPVMTRAHSPSAARALGGGLAKVLAGRKALLVASTDLSHFYPRETAGQLDATTLRHIGDFSPEALYQAAESGEAQACGLNAVAAVLWAARDLGAKRVQVLHYATSGDVTGDDSSVVGYGAAVILK